MTALPDFRLERYFSHWEFAARYHLTASDAQTMTMAELLSLAGEEDRLAWEQLTLGYTTTFGDRRLRELVVADHPDLDADDVVCFAGAEEGLYLAMQVLLGPDDHAVVLTPNYQSAETVPLGLCAVSGVALDPDADWALDVDAVRAALRPSTRVVSVNFPHNPTGAVPDRATFAALAALCDERGIHLFSDEVYRGLELDDGRRLPLAAELSPRALSLGVMSKALGLPGLRIGWVVCRDPAVRAALERAKHYTSICNSAPSEILARIALAARGTILERNRGIVAANLPHFEAFFAEFADLFDWRPPDGGCVAFPRWRGDGDVDTLCSRLVDEAGVLLLPAGIYRSELTPTPTDRFRIGVGRADPGPALAAFADWLRRR